ncbi:hypothetical protein KA005_82845 [bacterium]|nr:hypothetical protein [bacterium]
MAVTKTFINKTMKAKGQIVKRNRAEIVGQIKLLADKYGEDANNTIKTLLWSQGYSHLDSEKIAQEITTESVMRQGV